MRAYQNLLEVVNFLFLPDLGCLHLRAEWYLHRGVLESLPGDWPNDDNTNCGDKCFVCNGTHVKYMLPIGYEGAFQFLESDYFSGKDSMPYPITYEDDIKITTKLADSGDWRKKVFGKKIVAR